MGTFKGEDFYKARMMDPFLSDVKTVEGILCQAKKIRDRLRTFQPGQKLYISGALMYGGEQLYIKKGGQNVKILDLEYTLGRLTGMCAAFVANSTNLRPKCAMAISLGLNVEDDIKLYYSAAPGAEYFPEIFSYLPLLCAKYQLQIGKLTNNNVERIAAVRNAQGQNLAQLLAADKSRVDTFYQKFGKSRARGMIELERAIKAIREYRYNYDIAGTFKGEDFYKARMMDPFLSDVKTVEGILCQAKKIRDRLRTFQPGQKLYISGALMYGGEELYIKKGGQNVKILDLEYTLGRLTGMCAAFVANSTNLRPKCAMAISLGLNVEDDFKLYYSAAPGAEHFPEIFSYLPLLCAKYQLQIGKVTKNNVERIAAVRNAQGQNLAQLLAADKSRADTFYQKFGKSRARGMIELERVLKAIQEEVEKQMKLDARS